MNQKIKDVIVSACEQLDCSYEDQSLWFWILVNDCLKTMKTHKMISPFKKGKIEVQDCKAILPEDLIELSYVNTNAFMDPACMYVKNIDYVTQGHVVIFSTDLDLEDGDFLHIQYKGLKVDNEGNLEFDSRWERMLVAYISWKYCFKYLEKPGYQAKAKGYEREFVAQKLANL